MSTSPSPWPGTTPPMTQEPGFRNNWPVWLKDFPRLRFPPPRTDFQFVASDALKGLVAPEDLDVLEAEVLRLFRVHDYEAKKQQNRYRLYQIGFIILAMFATLFGSLQALMINTATTLLPWFSFAETVIALMATYLATISGREPPLPEWLNERRKAEGLRREYFRFVMNLEPYCTIPDAPARRITLADRATDINRGRFPDDQTGGA